LLFAAIFEAHQRHPLVAPGPVAARHCGHIWIHCGDGWNGQEQEEFGFVLSHGGDVFIRQCLPGTGSKVAPVCSHGYTTLAQILQERPGGHITTSSTSAA